MSMQKGEEMVILLEDNFLITKFKILLVDAREKNMIESICREIFWKNV